MMLMGGLGLCHRLAADQGHGDLGRQHPDRLGLRDHQLRLVDRHRPRRHADLGDPAAAQAGLAHVDQPLSPKDDDLRGHVRGPLPADPHRPSVARRLLAVPLPEQHGIWPQFRSPLIWDVFAVSTYFTVSLLFWYVGLIPDLATLRDKAKSLPVKMPTARWRSAGADRRALAALRARLPAARGPLDAAGPLGPHRRELRLRDRHHPGWHATIFPPYFVAGAIYAGFAMVLTLAIPLRKMYGLEDFITMRHLENMGKVTLVTGMIVGYGYVSEAFFGWYSAEQVRRRS
jgi:hypothetical protein